MTSFPDSSPDGQDARPSLNELALSLPEREKSHQWSQITQALVHAKPCAACTNAPPPDSTAVPKQRDFDIHNIKIAVLDRPTVSTVLISWKDSTRCNYGYQLWHVARSRKSGTCALSSKPIKVGDMVYRPYSGRSNPLNAEAMILAVLIDEK
jgi:hypothetical protein